MKTIATDLLQLAADLKQDYWGRVYYAPNEVRELASHVTYLARLASEEASKDFANKLYTLSAKLEKDARGQRYLEPEDIGRLADSITDLAKLARAQETVHHSPSLPRTVASATAGVATGLLGNVIPIIGLTGGLIMQLAEKDVPSFAKVGRITDGVVDGSAALLCHSLFRGTRARSLARPMAGPAKPRARPIRS